MQTCHLFHTGWPREEVIRTERRIFSHTRPQGLRISTSWNSASETEMLSKSSKWLGRLRIWAFISSPVSDLDQTRKAKQLSASEMALPFGCILSQKVHNLFVIPLPPVTKSVRLSLTGSTGVRLWKVCSKIRLPLPLDNFYCPQDHCQMPSCWAIWWS